MSRPEKEAILERVLAGAAPRVRWRHRLAVGVLAVAGVVMAVVVLGPVTGSGPRDELTARGGELSAGFELTCVPAPCTAGSKLVFDITSTGGAAYFAAFARHGEKLIWYFPSTPEARSRPLPPAGGLLDTGIVLGAEHAPGVYTVEGVFSPAPLDRPAIRAIVERGGAAVTRQVIVR